jgi:hypothetical protein
MALSSRASAAAQASEQIMRGVVEGLAQAAHSARPQ